MPVIGELIDKIQEMRSDIEKILGKLEKLRVEGLDWIPVSIDDTRDLVLIASDSSRQYENYRGILIYAIQGVAIAYSTTRGVVLDSQGAEAGVIEVVSRHKMEFKRIKEALIDNASKSLEVQLVERIIERGMKPHYILFDGSYDSFTESILVPPRLREKLEEKISSYWFQRLRSLENISSIAPMVFISKNISKSYLTQECGVTVRVEDEEVKAPDFLIVQRLIKEVSAKTPGLLWPRNPIITRGSKALRNKQKLLKLLDIEYTIRLPNEYTMFYVLLSPWGRTYRITVPGEISLSDAKTIVSSLANVSVNDGYPHPLAIAHHLCKLTNKEFKSLTRMIAPELESGREPLDQTIA